MNSERQWVEEHVLKGGDLLAYGRLLDELEQLSPDELWRELRTAASAYLADGDERTRLVHQRVDNLIDALTARDQRYGYPPPYCHRGCANCCHEVVYCTADEARGIHQHCAQEGIPIAYAKLLRQLEHVAADTNLDHTGVTTWSEQAQADQSCIFLAEDLSCVIWPVRPLVCRTHLAEQTDRHCRPYNGVADPEAIGINYLEVSYILSAVFTLHRDSIRKSLGRLLLELSHRAGLSLSP
jgi:Fe-S-cluster containining protein